MFPLSKDNSNIAITKTDNTMSLFKLTVKRRQTIGPGKYLEKGMTINVAHRVNGSSVNFSNPEVRNIIAQQFSTLYGLDVRRSAHAFVASTYDIEKIS